MKAALFGKSVNPEFLPSIEFLLKSLKQHNCSIAVFKPFFNFLTENIKFDFDEIYETISCGKKKYDLIFSIGGDGTFLECAESVNKCDIPIVGINSGRLGFLADISKEELQVALSDIHKKNYIIEERSLLQLTSNPQIFENYNYALNEITVQKRDTGSMINIQVFIDNIFMNTYWADGLIISTPTGSTAYSLSVGGPIVVPGSKNFIITPIAPHNLTVRPLVVPDSVEIKIVVESRNENFLATLDHKSAVVAKERILHIKTADFKIKTLKLENKTYFATLRNKLLWGIDKRN